MFYWIYDHPNWLMATLFMTMFATLSIVGLLLFRKYLADWLDGGIMLNEVVGIASSSFAMLYGLLLGLMAVAAYQDYTDTTALVDREAASLAALYRDSEGYPMPLRGDLQGILREYTRNIIDVGWPLQQKGIVFTHPGAILTEGFHKIHGFKPADVGEAAAHAEVMREASALMALRYERLSANTLCIPPLMWGVVLFGAFISILLSWMLRVPIRMHMAITALLASFLGLIIFAIASLDFPFRGVVSVDASAFERVYSQVMR